MNNPFITKVRKTTNDLPTIQLYYEKDGQPIADISADGGIRFYTDEGFYIYAQTAREVLTISENFSLFWNSL